MSTMNHNPKNPNTASNNNNNIKKNKENNNSSSNNNSNSNSKRNQNKKRSLDGLFQQHGKSLQVGEEYRMKIYKGPSMYQSNDPVDGKAPTSYFPLIAKFPISSVVKPEFTQHPWDTSRLYEQDIPKPIDDSDEEDNMEKKKRWKYNKQEVAARQWILQEQVDFLETMVSKRENKKKQQQDKKNGGGTSSSSVATATSATAATTSLNNDISSRYEGVPEHTTSHYAIVRIDPSSSSASNRSKVMIQLLPQMATITFQQPSARRTLTLNQAEQMIQDQRAGLRAAWTMDRTDHDKLKQQQLQSSTTTSANQEGSASKKPMFGGGGGMIQRPTSRMQVKSTKDRLLKKLNARDHNDEIDEADDIMADVTFRSRKGSGGQSAARRELLTSLGDGITVSDDGVLGGTNDAAFGGRQRFGKLQTDNTASANEGGGSNEDGGNNSGGVDHDGNHVAGSINADYTNNDSAERGADGAAMSDDFYTRDVGAEYEELDFDAAEQFDDDDVDLGEGEMVFDNQGYNEDDDEDDSDSDADDENDETIGGAEGLASVAGFKALLAKARGEAIIVSTTTNQSQDGNSSNTNGVDDTKKNNIDDGKNMSINGNSLSSPDQQQQQLLQQQQQQQQQQQKKRRRNDDDNEVVVTDHFSKIEAAAELANEKANAKKKQRIGENNNMSTDSSAPTASATTSNNSHNHIMNQSNNSMNNNNTIAPIAVDTGVQIDENGLRIITLTAVQKEIWLNHGSITMKRLMKIFDVKKKSTKIRQDQFKDIVKELCTISKDPIKGMMLVLKQHYSNMG